MPANRKLRKQANIDIGIATFSNIGRYMAHYMSYIYRDNPKMMDLINRYFLDYRYAAFSRLNDRSIISHFHQVHWDFGCLLDEYFKDGVLQTTQINYDLNAERITSRLINGKSEYGIAAKWFEEMLKERYSTK